MSSANFLPILFCFTIWRRFTRHTFFMRKLFWNFSYKYIWFLEMIMFSILHGTRKKSNKIDSDCISREVSDYVCLQWWNWNGCWLVLCFRYNYALRGGNYQDCGVNNDQWWVLTLSWSRRYQQYIAPVLSAAPLCGEHRSSSWRS